MQQIKLPENRDELIKNFIAYVYARHPEYKNFLTSTHESIQRNSMELIISSIADIFNLYYSTLEKFIQFSKEYYVPGFLYERNNDNKYPIKVSVKISHHESVDIDYILSYIKSDKTFLDLTEKEKSLLAPAMFIITSLIFHEYEYQEDSNQFKAKRSFLGNQNLESLSYDLYHMINSFELVSTYESLKNKPRSSTFDIIFYFYCLSFFMKDFQKFPFLFDVVYSIPAINDHGFISMYFSHLNKKNNTECSHPVLLHNFGSSHTFKGFTNQKPDVEVPYNSQSFILFNDSSLNSDITWKMKLSHYFSIFRVFLFSVQSNSGFTNEKLYYYGYNSPQMSLFLESNQHHDHLLQKINRENFNRFEKFQVPSLHMMFVKEDFSETKMFNSIKKIIEESCSQQTYFSIFYESLAKISEFITNPAIDIDDETNQDDPMWSLYAMMQLLIQQSVVFSNHAHKERIISTVQKTKKSEEHDSTHIQNARIVFMTNGIPKSDAYKHEINEKRSIVPGFVLPDNDLYFERLFIEKNKQFKEVVESFLDVFSSFDNHHLDHNALQQSKEYQNLIKFLENALYCVPQVRNFIISLFHTSILICNNSRFFTTNKSIKVLYSLLDSYKVTYVPSNVQIQESIGTHDSFSLIHSLYEKF